MEKVSIIIPVYNVEAYLEECLESVLSQTYENLEVICVDDCSTDGSLSILGKYAQKDSRIIIIENRENRGQAYARNIGMDKAAGEYILFVDADDAIDPKLLERCVEVGHGCDMVCFDYRQVAGDETDVKQDKYQMQDGLYSGSDFFTEAVYRESIIVAPWSKLYSRKFLADQYITFYEGIIYEDILFSFYCYLKAEKVCSLNLKLYKYRVRSQSTMEAEITEKNIGSYMICICELMKEFLKEDFDERTANAVEAYIRKVSREYINVYRRWKGKGQKLRLLEDKPEYLKIYRTFSELCVKAGKELKLDQGQIEEMRQYPYVVLYGAGDIARSVVELMDYHDIPLYGIAVTSLIGNRKSLLGNPIKELKEYKSIRKECLVLIGTTSKYYHEIREQLKGQGFIHFMELMNR